jgi:hypothetical protein
MVSTDGRRVGPDAHGPLALMLEGVREDAEGGATDRRSDARCDAQRL